MTRKVPHYFEVTRKRPGKLRPGTTKAITYEVISRLKKSGEERVIDEVLAHGDFKTRQEDPENQVRWYLWDFVSRGILKKHESRRYVRREEKPKGDDDLKDR